MKQSQTAQILTALQSGDRLTPIDALNRFGCFRLSARVSDIKDRGYRVQDKYVKMVDGTKFKEYWMETNGK